MWEAIAYVSSGITLAAFVASVIAWSFKSKSEERERLIRTAKESDRGDLVRNALEFFNVDTAGLTKEQQFKLSLEQIHARGQRFKISAAVICFLALVAAGITAYAIAQHSRDQETLPADRTSKSAVIDPALVGSWESVGKVQTYEVQLRFEFGADGKFSRRYFLKDGGVIETEQDDLKMKGVKTLTTVEGKYAFNGTDTLTLTSRNGSAEFKRVGTSDYPQDALVGTWKTSVLLAGANWDWTIDIGRERNYHSNFEAHDEGFLTAADGRWQMTSNWSTVPIDGTYRVFAQGAPQFNIWPFGTITLQRSR